VETAPATNPRIQIENELGVSTTNKFPTTYLLKAKKTNPMGQKILRILN
jgi:hypothetical protein